VVNQLRLPRVTVKNRQHISTENGVLVTFDICFAGSINATVHREVIKEHAAHFHAGTVIVLRQASAQLQFYISQLIDC